MLYIVTSPFIRSFQQAQVLKSAYINFNHGFISATQTPSHCLDTTCSCLQQTFLPNGSLKSFVAEQPSLRRDQALHI